LPVPAYNNFNKLLDSLGTVGFDSVVPFKVEEFTASEFLSKSWPVQPGSYRVINQTNSIAIALLQDVTVEELSNLDLSPVAIAGTITTENLGRELARAELSLVSKQPFVQDKAQGRIEPYL
jgi:hypothetical protein